MIHIKELLKQSSATARIATILGFMVEPPIPLAPEQVYP